MRRSLREDVDDFLGFFDGTHADTLIANGVYNAVKRYMTPSSTYFPVTKESVRKAMKEQNMMKYIEYSTLISSMLKDRFRPVAFSEEERKVILHMYRQVLEEAQAPPLAYPLILNRIVRLVRNEPLMPDWDILSRTDEITQRTNSSWSQVCERLQWTFHPVDNSLLKRNFSENKSDVCVSGQ